MARWMLGQEARALLTRLGRVKPFALQETMLPAAALSPAALIAIERFLVGNRHTLREQVREYAHWLEQDGRNVSPAEMQRRFTIVRLRFNDVLSQFDLFSEVITQRSEAETGVWLSGLDVFAADALSLPGGFFEAPQVICYLARGPGAAVRRARTRLPGGGDNPVAIVRVPRERMVGHGIASSLVHEVGHQAAALLDLVPSLRPVLHAYAERGHPREREAWTLYERWVSEIVADLYSVAKLGIGSTLGLIGVVSMPNWFVFRIATDDPHPVPWIRVRLSCAVGDALYPHPQWQELSELWEALYPRSVLKRDRQRTLQGLDRTVPQFVEVLLGHRPASLHGLSLGDVLPFEDRRPAQLAALYRAWRGRREQLREAPPTLAFAVLGQARAMGLLDPEQESRTVGNLLTYWALRSTLDIAEICAAPVSAPTRREQRLLETQPV
ncbi:MAG TPA: hypothetical protein VF101_01085 [Gaiellaceae bacterium]